MAVVRNRSGHWLDITGGGSLGPDEERNIDTAPAHEQALLASGALLLVDPTVAPPERAVARSLSTQMGTTLGESFLDTDGTLKLRYFTEYGFDGNGVAYRDEAGVPDGAVLVANPVSNGIDIVDLNDPTGLVIATTEDLAAEAAARAEAIRQALASVSGLTAGVERTANKGVASGYASLGADAKVPLAQLGTLAIVRVAAVTYTDGLENTPDTLTIPANTLVAGDVLSVWSSLRISNNPGAATRTLTVRLNFAGQLLASSALSVATGISGRQVGIRAFATVRSIGAAGKAIGEAMIVHGTSAADGMSVERTVNTTADQGLSISVQWDLGDANTSCTVEQNRLRKER